MTRALFSKRFGTAIGAVALSFGALLGTPEPARAQLVQTCATYSSSSPMVYSGAGAAADVIFGPIQLEVDDVLVFSTLNTVEARVAGPGPAAAFRNPDRYAVTVAGAYTVTFESLSEGGIFEGVATCETQLPGSTTGLIQNDAILNALTHGAEGRFGNGTGAGASASRNGLRFAPRSRDGDMNLFGSVEGRQFNGNFDGNAYDATIGVDWLVASGTALGVMGNYSGMEAANGTGTTRSRTLSVAPYVIQKIGQDMMATGFLSFGRPDYDAPTGSFTADRRAFGLRLRGSQQMGAFLTTPTLDIRAMREIQPAHGARAENVVQTFNARAMMRVEMDDMGVMGMNPYASFGLEYGKNDETLMGTSSYTSPRLAIGAQRSMANGGSLTADLDLGQIGQGTRDAGLRIGYKMGF